MAELIVLGTAQDGGLPHAGCRCVQCERARREPGFRRLPAAVGIRSGEATVLIDATNAFAEQIHLLQCRAAGNQAGGRYAPPATVLLTHAHTRHYVGLWQLDRSALGAPDVRVTPLPVPHRSEWGTDTVAYRIDGPRRSVLYLPDIDDWSGWHLDVADIVASVDVALIDGTFWEPFSRPGVPHPPVRESLDRLAAIARDGDARILFTHLNHSNPLADREGAEAAEVRERGFGVAEEGERVSL